MDKSGGQGAIPANSRSAVTSHDAPRNMVWIEMESWVEAGGWAPFPQAAALR